MSKTYKITAEQVAELTKAREKEHNTSVDKRLRAVLLRSEGKKNSEIAEIVETVPKVVSRWISEYAKHGIVALLPKERKGNRRNMSIEEEAEILSLFNEKAEQGQIIEISDIETAYQNKVGHKIGNGQIYRVLKRHNWRKIKPRSRHPKKASAEAIEASKKLTLESKN